jgi:hypothetical protein
MTNAERQAKRRKKLRDMARQRLIADKQAADIGTYQPPKGYQQAKTKLQQQGHSFERARREFGFEEGTFIDGAFVLTREVIALVDLPASERQQWLADQRQRWKNFAVAAVMSYMKAMRVSVDELCGHWRPCL